VLIRYLLTPSFVERASKPAHSANILRTPLANICAEFHGCINLVQDRFIGIVL
jgi:hypothetical protein